VGASGSGKTTITNALVREYALTVVSSYTTRPPRYEGEEGHIFVTDEDFDSLKDICAQTLYDGYRYCATKQQIDNSDLYVIDPAGVQYFLQTYTGEKKPVVLHIVSDESERITRMKARGDTDEQIERRLSQDGMPSLFQSNVAVFGFENRNLQNCIMEIGRLIQFLNQ
jgi:guanylate kinase